MWLKDGKPLDLSNDRYVKDKVKHKSCLVIKTAKIEDIGVYTCQSQKANDLPERADIKLIGNLAHSKQKSASIKKILKYLIFLF